MLDIYLFQTYFFLDVNNSRPVQEVFPLPLGMLTFLKMVLPSLTRYLRCPGTSNYPTLPLVPRNVWGVAPLPWGTSLLSNPSPFCGSMLPTTHDYIRKEFNHHMIFLAHQHGRRFIVLEHQYGRRDVMWKSLIATSALKEYDFSQSQIRDTFCSFTDHFLRPVSIW